MTFASLLYVVVAGTGHSSLARKIYRLFGGRRPRLVGRAFLPLTTTVGNEPAVVTALVAGPRRSGARVQRGLPGELRALHDAA
jgi:hypothetical protein